MVAAFQHYAAMVDGHAHLEDLALSVARDWPHLPSGSHQATIRAPEPVHGTIAKQDGVVRVRRMIWLVALILA